MKQKEEDVELGQFKFSTQCTVIIFYLFHLLIIVAIIIIASLGLQNNQNSVQVVQWCTIELTLITYYLLQQIYELRNQFYFINLIVSNPQQLAFPKKEQEYFQLNFYTRYLSSNIFFFCNNTYIKGLFFSADQFFRETKRKIPRTEVGSNCYDSKGYDDECLNFEIETIAPQYHGPYLTELANLNVILFAFYCLYLLYRVWLLKINIQINQRVQEYKFDINIQSIKKESQILCIILTVYYICRVTHSFIIYPQVKNETLLYSIEAYIFYSLMMITVLISVITLIQLKFAQKKENIYSFITVFSLIDSIIYDNRYLKYYLRIMLIASFIFTSYGSHKYSSDKEIQDIVNYQNYVLADLIIAQIVFISLMLIKYSPLPMRSLFCFNQIYHKLSNVNNNQLQQQNPIALTSQEDQNQQHKKQANLINQNKLHSQFNWAQYFKQFKKIFKEKQRSFIYFKIVNTLRINPIRQQKYLKNKMYSILNLKILKFWKRKIKNPSNLKKRKIMLLIFQRKINKQQENPKINTPLCNSNQIKIFFS